MHMHTYTCIYVHIYMHMQTDIYIYICIIYKYIYINTSYAHIHIICTLIHTCAYIYIHAYAHINHCMQAYAGCICQHWSRRRGWGETGWAGAGAMHLGGLWEAQKHDLVIVLASFSRARARAGETLRCIPPPMQRPRGCRVLLYEQQQQRQQQHAYYDNAQQAVF